MLIISSSVFYQDVEKTRSLDAFEADRSIIELKEEIGHGEFGRCCICMSWY